MPLDFAPLLRHKKTPDSLSLRLALSSLLTLPASVGACSRVDDQKKIESKGDGGGIGFKKFDSELILESSCDDGLGGSRENCGEMDLNKNDDLQGNSKESVCGDSVLDSDEECDGGHFENDYAVCNRSCKFSTCGDGFLSPTEECDEGELNGENGNCLEDCTFNTCGDGFVSPTEECDLGEKNNDQLGECTTLCNVPRCGDGILGGGEICGADRDVKTLRLQMNLIHFIDNGEAIGSSDVRFRAFATSSDGSEDDCTFIDESQARLKDGDFIPVYAVCDIQVNPGEEVWVRFNFMADVQRNNGYDRLMGSYQHFLSPFNHEWSGSGAGSLVVENPDFYAHVKYTAYGI